VALYELFARPSLERPVLVMHFDGFIDAGGSASMAARTILGVGESETPSAEGVLGRFDSEALLDYRARRPTMHLVDGVNTGLTWPAIELRLCHDQNGRALLLLMGPEPDHLWPSFARSVAEIAREFNVRLVVNLGAYPAATPHTRPPHITATATSAELSRGLGVLQTTLDVPSGIHAVIEHECAAHNIAAIGVWAQVPHYASQMPYPASAIALIEGLRALTSLSFDVTELSQQAANVQLHLAELVARNDEHVQMVRQLEMQDDVLRQNRSSDLPSGDEIAAEVERYLREQDE
jgi:predicted ATP-grasp superfamily ATP-dependent carboligase